MSEFVTGKLDVTKIDKTLLFKGVKGTYLDFAMIPTPDNKHGDDWMIVQSLPKEERDAGKRGPIIGNAKKHRKQSSSNAPKTPNTQEADDSDSVPF